MLSTIELTLLYTIFNCHLFDKIETLYFQSCTIDDATYTI